MEEYKIYVHQVEEWQMLNDSTSLDHLFQRAKRNLVGGGTAALVRNNPNGRSDTFEVISTLEDLEAYRKRVYKNLH